jgi:aryl-alcohol dehydrogenase
MSRTITAAVLRHPDAPFQLEELRLPEPEEDQILVRIAASGMCHTDLMPRQPGSFVRPPIVVGHEGSGVVDAVGPGVTDLAVGDHVVLTFDSCGTCRNCREGHPAYCTTFWRRNMGGQAVNGHAPATDADGSPVAVRWFGQSSFATHALASPRNAVRVDRTLPLHLLAPLGCSVQTGAASIITALAVTLGDTVAVFGTGSVGLTAVMAAHAIGAITIVAVDARPKRLELARELGATHTVSSGTEDVRRALKRIAPEDATPRSTRPASPSWWTPRSARCGCAGAAPSSAPPAARWSYRPRRCPSAVACTASWKATRCPTTSSRSSSSSGARAAYRSTGS